MNYVLRTFNLSKRYKSTVAVDNANMNICEGDIYGFVGENGSGKTTIIRLISGLVHPDGGSFELFGVKNTAPEITEARRGLGAIVESPSIFRNMSASENLKLQCTLLGLDGSRERIFAALDAVGLSELIDEKRAAGDFSLGMRQRLGIAMALLGSPRLILLDEPMNGLDPAGIVDIREMILRLNRKEGITFLISSHILSELALVATKYGIISKGHVIREISADSLHGIFGKLTLIKTDNLPLTLSIAKELCGEDSVATEADSVRISGAVNLNLLFGKIIENGICILEVNCSETSFEEYYLSLVGGKNNA